MHNRDRASAEFRRDINGQRALAAAVVSHEIQHGSLLGRPFHHDDEHPSEYGNQPLAPGR
jgi:hypothetical protein